MKLTIEPVRHRLRRPLVTAWGELRERELLEVTLSDGDGLAGRGEAAALEPYDGVAPAALRSRLLELPDVLTATIVNFGERSASAS